MSTTLEIKYPRRRVVRALLKTAIRLAFAASAKVSIEGLEHLPRNKPYLIVGNHFSHVDPLVMVRVVPRQVEFLGGLNLVHVPPILRALPHWWGYFPVYRGLASRDALRAAESILKQGGVFSVFPEGGAWANVLRPARPGTAFLAVRTGVPIVPVGIMGAEDVLPTIAKPGRVPMTIRIGTPIGPFSTTRRGPAKRAELDAIGDTIMRAIAELLPPERHGVFSSDPTLREAAQEVAAYPWADANEFELESREVYTR